jgi:DnaJ-class molecular chaperone
VSQNLRRYTERHTTPRLRPIAPSKIAAELDLYGMIKITPKEAHHGTRKLISVSQGLRKRNIMVAVPPDVKNGTRLRLKGLGQKDTEGNRGDLFLEIRING